MKLPILIRYPCGIAGLEENSRDLIQKWLDSGKVRNLDPSGTNVVATGSWKTSKDDEQALVLKIRQSQPHLS